MNRFRRRSDGGTFTSLIFQSGDAGWDSRSLETETAGPWSSRGGWNGRSPTGTRAREATNSLHHHGNDLTSADAPHVFEELSGGRERQMIIRITTPARLQQRYGYRLRYQSDARGT